jgi:glycosyltransferase involved in cell wall biosynthesis
MISDFYPPHLGGTERAVSDLSAALSARGHEVLVATLWSDGLAHRERDDAVTVHRLQSAVQHAPFLFKQQARPYHPPARDPLVAGQLRRLISSERPDVVHGHSWMMISALPARRDHGFASVATLNDYALLCPKKTLLFDEERPCTYHLSHHCLSCARQMYGVPKGILTAAGLALGRRAYSRVDAFVAISSYIAGVHARDAALAGACMTTIPNFVRDDVRCRPVGTPIPDLPADYILFVGALGRHKGLNVLLDAYASLRTSLPLVLIGTVQPETPRTLPPGVTMIPGLPHDEIIRAMDHCRFLVSPALWPEPFGLVAIEAMARGKAVVAGRAGGMLDIVQDGQTGLLVTPGDAASLAVAMRALIEDPCLAERMGRQGSARCAAAFSAATVVNRIVGVYHGARRRALREDA